MGKHSARDRKHQRHRRSTLRWVRKFNGRMVIFETTLRSYLGEAKKQSGNYLAIWAPKAPSGVWPTTYSGATALIYYHDRHELRLATDSDIVMERLSSFKEGGINE